MKKQTIIEQEVEEEILAKEAKKRANKEAKARVEKKAAKSNSIIRFIICGIVILLQLGLGIFLFIWLDNYFTIVYTAFRVISILLVLFLVGRVWNSAFKISWLIFIMISPVVGVVLYFLLGRNGTAGPRKKAKYARIWEMLGHHYPKNDELILKYEKDYPELYHQLYYLLKVGKFPPYHNTDVKYYSKGKFGLDAQVEELKKAKKFIFMEYHAIENEESFGRIKEVLFQKVKEGVEVRVFYDDMGSIGFINKKFIKEMNNNGVNCRVFNPITPLMVFFMNNRDHRKITVIDGKVGFTGGYNLANEYFDVTHPYGEWKDTGIRLEGDAVKSLTLIFLENWNGIEESDTSEGIMKYLVDYDYKAKENNGIIVPYSDGPVDQEALAETLYMNLIRDSKHYIMISTPYLLITDEMTRELCDASRRGIDVSIITPGIPDKKMVYRMTRSYYMTLAKAGVKIYEYKPGFVHAKMMLVDDYMAIVGTINFDYRSLYHHFENACFMSGYECVKDIRTDFDSMISKSRDVTEKHAAKIHLGPLETLLRLISPLM